MTWTGLPQPITISEGANLMAAQLNKWAEPFAADVKIMASMSHLWEEIRAVTDRPRILIALENEVSRGGQNVKNRLHRVDRHWVVVVMRGHGFNANITVPGLTATGNVQPAFLDHCESIRDVLRAMPTISEEWPIRYDDLKPLPNPAPTPSSNVFMDAYAIRLQTANDIPDFELSP